MLVLTRKYQEKILIGDGITITILRTKGKAVRLGIEAPAEVPVIRGELTFNESPADCVEKTATATSESGQGARNANRQSGRATGPAKWSTELHDGKSKPQVTLERVPRNKAAEVLPRLLSESGNAPLREMLQQRSRAV